MLFRNMPLKPQTPTNFLKINTSCIVSFAYDQLALNDMCSRSNHTRGL